jgi:hypothetical protein
MDVYVSTHDASSIPPSACLPAWGVFCHPSHWVASLIPPDTCLMQHFPDFPHVLSPRVSPPRPC